ncbi:hypothetical protein KC19_6G024600 [Ceratodon purpureus]|uniref:Uncharacterized protein n=1 Tax=Ceratodon purpureus TaxID=3225 RepID=A0A8T0HEE6_CERPU|nr:hypothetical protein KC19_6G024600 [Ceratodon purpureus]
MLFTIIHMRSRICFARGGCRKDSEGRRQGFRSACSTHEEKRCADSGNNISRQISGHPCKRRLLATSWLSSVAHFHSQIIRSSKCSALYQKLGLKQVGQIMMLEMSMNHYLVQERSHGIVHVAS